MSFVRASLGTASLALLTSACTTLLGNDPAVYPATPVTSPSTVSSTTSTATSSTSPSPNYQPPPFDSVIKGAQRIDGLLPLWKRQDRVWIELSPQALGHPLFLSPKLATGIGEGGVFGGLMQSRWAQVGRPQWVEFRKVQQQIQLLAVNAAYTAQAGTPQAKAVQAAFSPSLLSSVPLASAPQGKSGAVLVDANALLVTDILGLAQHLQRGYRQSYALDSRNSALIQARTQPQGLVFEVAHHLATSSISSGGVPGATSTTPTSVPDPRSLFVNVHYSLSDLPEQAMPPRLADVRVGYFTTTVADFTNDLARTPRVRFINRWRLDKQDPSAPLSPPRKPLVFWLDPSIPDAYRPTIIEAVLEWNKAFAAIGFQNAIEVRTPPSDQAFDTLETGHTSIRWMTNSQPGFGAIGPTHVDPRTGEILDADIALESLSSRAIRTVRSQYFSATPLLDRMRIPDANDLTNGLDGCTHGAEAAEQLGLALDVMEAQQGTLDPDAPLVKDFLLAYIKETVMHEVGHTLGLRHNFRASRWRTQQELGDPVLTREKGNSASVMDYTPINLPAPGQRAGAPFQTTLGPYDYWAIEYGYKPLEGDASAQETALRDIAQRSALPANALTLAFGTDEDSYFGLDPQALSLDLGRDPLVFAKTRLAIVNDLFARMEQRRLGPREDASVLRRAVSYGLRDMGRTSQVLLRQIGGLITRRDAPGRGRDLLEPLPASQQRAALDLLLKSYLAPQPVNLSPALQRRLAPDYFDRTEGGGDNVVAGITDFSLAEQLLALQREIMANLMNESLAERLLDNMDKTRDRERQPLTVRELHRRITETVWASPSPVSRQAGRRSTIVTSDDSRQRNLQRDHVNRLAAAVVRASTFRADVRATLRQEASDLLRKLQGRRAGATPDSTAEAHRRDCLETLQRALQATVQRNTP